MKMLTESRKEKGLSGHRGEGFILDVSADQARGRTVSVFDQNFAEVLRGTF